ncbi:MAG: DUF86 domain-containing protein [Spirochaetota bacterium]
MSKRDYHHLISDILNDIEKINNYIEGLSYEDFKYDEKTKDAVVKNLIEIGEAANHIPPNIIEKYTDIPWQQMISLRHRLIHGYFIIDYDIVWIIVKEELPIVYKQLKCIVNQDNI